MEMMLFRSPLGDIVVQMTESKDTAVTLVLERPDAERLVELLKEKLELSAPIDWKDVEYDDDLAAMVRHQVMGLSKGTMVTHGGMDRIRVSTSMDVPTSERMRGQLDEAIKRLRSGRVDRIEPLEDPTERIREVRKA